MYVLLAKQFPEYFQSISEPSFVIPFFLSKNQTLFLLISIESTIREYPFPSVQFPPLARVLFSFSPISKRIGDITFGLPLIAIYSFPEDHTEK